MMRGYWVKLRNPFTGETEEIRRKDWDSIQSHFRKQKTQTKLLQLIGEVK